MPGPTARQMTPSPTSTNKVATPCRSNAGIRNLTKSANTARQALHHMSTPRLDRAGGANIRALLMARQARGLPTSHGLRRNACWARLPQAEHEAQKVNSLPGSGHSRTYAFQQRPRRPIFTPPLSIAIVPIISAASIALLIVIVCSSLPSPTPQSVASS